MKINAESANHHTCDFSAHENIVIYDQDSFCQSMRFILDISSTLKKVRFSESLVDTVVQESDQDKIMSFDSDLAIMSTTIQELKYHFDKVLDKPNLCISPAPP